MPSEKEKPRVEGSAFEERAIEPRDPHDIFHAFDAMWEDFRRDFLQPWRPWKYWDRDPRIWGMLTQRKACADLVDTGTDYQVCVEVPGIGSRTIPPSYELDRYDHTLQRRPEEAVDANR
jgi:hypothetical protein